MSQLLDDVAALDRFATVDLDELERTASLQTRFDRKYLVPAPLGTALLRALHDDVGLLSIDGLCAFGYHTVYFDNESRDSYLGTARRRRHRFKVRTRDYVDTNLSVLEVKRRGRRGATVKVRAVRHIDDGTMLAAAEQEFIDRTLGHEGVSAGLLPVLSTFFVRSTLLDRRDGSRVTLDRDVEVMVPGGDSIVLEGRSILETKSVGAATAADRWLWASGFRPISFSKFCIGMALHHPDLPANKWNRVLRRDLGWRPHGESDS